MSPRRFNRRTYMMAASGRSVLIFKAAMSASSAPTTIRSAFPFAITPTVNCQDIFEPFAKLSELLLRIETDLFQFGECIVHKLIDLRFGG